MGTLPWMARPCTRMGTRTVFSLFIFGILFTQTPNSVNGTLDASLINTKLDILANTTLGSTEFQDYLDNDVTVVSTPIDGSTLVSQLGQSIGDKFSNSSALVGNLKSNVEENFNTYKHEYKFNEFSYCCEKKEENEYDTRFKGNVNRDTLCIRESSYVGSTASYATRTLLDAFKHNMVLASGVKWQYVGTEQGVLFMYPSQKAEDCQFYDPRFRPWYVETTSPVPKDLVIVIDKSGSMGFDRNKINGQHLMDVAKEAAKTVLDTLSPKDRVGVIAFSSYAYTPSVAGMFSCFGTSLASATPANRKFLYDYIDSVSAGGSTEYARGLDKAFDLLRDTPVDPDFPDRKKAIIFLTDGDPSDSSGGDRKTYILSVMNGRNAGFGNEVSIFTFGIGGVSSTGQDILSAMASQSHALGKPGAYTLLSDAGKLRQEMGSYYHYYSQPLAYPIISMPYFDAFGLGMVVTVSLPVFYEGEFIGVAGIDISLADMMSDVAFLQQGGGIMSYAFVIDGLKNAISHPLIPKPQDVNEDPVFVDINHLEYNTGLASIIDDMASGGSGSTTLTSSHIVPRGEEYRGISQVSVSTEYHWTPVPQTNFSVCLVLSVGDAVHGLPSMSPTVDTPFLYHQLNITDLENRQTCLQFIRIAVKDVSTVKFSAKAFKNPFEYLDRMETSDDVNMYKNIINNAATNYVFADGVIEDVKLTAKIHDIWFNEGRWENNMHVIWRYVATANGVMRITPGVTLDKSYDPSMRSWYRQAVGNPDRLIVSAPYLDAFGAGFVVTISKAVFYSGGGNSLLSLVGVVSADVSLGYFYSLLDSTYSECRESGQSCFLVDQEGYLVIHKNFITVTGHESPMAENIHVVNRERTFAKYLLDNAEMDRHSCFQYSDVKKSFYFEIETSSLISNLVGSPLFELQPVINTNLLLGIITGDPTSPACTCNDSRSQRPGKCIQPSHYTCECPCWSDADYDPCDNSFTISDPDPRPCVPREPAISVYDQVRLEYLQYKEDSGMAMCHDPRCELQEAPESCYGRAGCSWCVRDKNGDLLETAFCIDQKACYFGQMDFPDPYEELFDFLGAKFELPWYIILLVVLGGISAIGIVIFAYRQHHRCGDQNVNRRRGPAGTGQGRDLPMIDTHSTVDNNHPTPSPTSFIPTSQPLPHLAAMPQPYTHGMNQGSTLAPRPMVAYPQPPAQPQYPLPPVQAPPAAQAYPRQVYSPQAGPPQVYPPQALYQGHQQPPPSPSPGPHFGQNTHYAVPRPY